MSKTVFVDKDPASGVVGTIIKADFMNAINNHHHSGLAVDGAGALPYAADSGAGNSYAIALSPVLPQYIIGMPIYFKAANANSDACTLNINNLGTISIKKHGTVDLLEGDISVGQIVGVVYDGTNFQIITPLFDEALRPGDIILSTLASAPAGAVKIEGATLSRSAYAALFANVVPRQNVSISIASPGIITTLAAHGFEAGERVRLETTGMLPTGLSVNTDYYIASVLSTTTFTIATAPGGTAITTSGTQSGTHTISIWRGYGPGDGVSTFTLPDFRGYGLRFWDAGAGVDSGRTFGSKQTDSVVSHMHHGYVISATLGGMGGGNNPGHVASDGSADGHIESEGITLPYGGTETRMKNVSIQAFIKY